MRNINKVILVGNLTRDPEMRRTLNGQNVAVFGLATNREWMTKDNRREQSSEFHEVVCWGRLAEIVGQFLKKGRLVYIEGHLKTRSWDDQSGVKKFRTEIVAQDLIMLEKKPKEMAQSAVASQEPAGPAESSESFQPSVTVEDPF